jgi:hypothetical protein
MGQMPIFFFSIKFEQYTVAHYYCFVFNLEDLSKVVISSHHEAQSSS